MANKGGNKGADRKRSEDTAEKNRKDHAVAKDPDIGGVRRRASDDAHMRDRRDRD
jgi:hypothetical protein